MSEDLFDPATHAMDRLIPFMELAQDFLLVATPHAGGDDPGNAAFGTNSGDCQIFCARGHRDG